MRYLLLLMASLSILSLGCKKSKPEITPDAASLVMPAKNSICIEGQIVNNTETMVAFHWSDAANASSYELVVRNLSDGSTTRHSSQVSEIKIPLKRGKAYSWNVISKSKSGGKTSESEAWRFYSANGDAPFYAPFPTEITAPKHNSNTSTSTVQLQWQPTTDVDGDLNAYYLYIGTSIIGVAPIVLKPDVTSYSYNVIRGNAYSWFVLAVDSKGNTSNSGTYRFYSY